MQTVLCPKCASMCLPSDPACFKCRTPIAGGGRMSHKRMAQLSSLVFAMGMLGFTTAYFPMKSGDSLIAHSLTVGIFAGGAAVVGRVVGWMIGAVVCRS